MKHVLDLGKRAIFFAFFLPSAAFAQGSACDAWNLLPDIPLFDLRGNSPAAPFTVGIPALTFTSGERYSVDLAILNQVGGALSDVNYGFEQAGVATAGFPITLIQPVTVNVGTVTFVNSLDGVATLQFVMSEENGAPDVINVSLTNFTCNVPSNPGNGTPTSTTTTPPTSTPAPAPVMDPEPVIETVIDLGPIQSFQSTGGVHSSFSYSSFAAFTGLLEGIRTRMRTHHAGLQEFHHRTSVIESTDENGVTMTVEQPSRFELFTQGKLNFQDKDSIRDDPGFYGEMETASVGAEFFLNPYWLIGAGLTAGRNDLEIGGLGQGKVTGEVLNFYTSYFKNGWFADLRYAGAMMDSELTRIISPEISVFSETNSFYHAVTLETGKNFEAGNWVHGPIIGGDYLHGGQDGYRERGNSAYNLIIGEQDFSSLISRIGWSVSRPMKIRNIPVIPQLRAAWERDWINDPEALGYTFEQSPVSFFEDGEFVGYGERPSGTIQTEAPGDDWLTLGLTLSTYLGREQQWNVALNYEGEFFRSNYSEHFGSIRVGFSF